MGLAESVLALMPGRNAATRAWPVGPGVVQSWDTTWGHQDQQYSPEEYGDYLATSNEIYSAAMLRARMMSSLRLGLFMGDDATKRAMPEHAASKLLRFVNPHWTRRRLAWMDELSMCLWGESYWAVQRKGRGMGEPYELWWCKPSRMRPVLDESNYIKAFVYEPQHGYPLIRFEPHEILWLRYPNPLDEFTALSPVMAVKLAADAASAMMKSNRNMFSNGLQVAGLIVPPEGLQTFTPEQADDLEAYLRRKLTGADKAHRWAVLRYEAAFKQLSITPKDAEFVGGLSLTLRQVANGFGIPLPLLNDMSGATLANVDALTKAFWAHTLVPDSSLRAEEIVEQYLPMFGRGAPDHAEFDYSSVPALQEAASAVWDRDAQQMDRAAITINEWRARNGLPSVKWGERPWMPLNKAQIGEDGKLEMPAPQGGMQGGPVAAGANGDPVEKVPDDERNPANKAPQVRVGHHQARAFLASLSPSTNGHRVRAS